MIAELTGHPARQLGVAIDDTGTAGTCDRGPGWNCADVRLVTDPPYGVAHVSGGPRIRFRRAVRDRAEGRRQRRRCHRSR